MSEVALAFDRIEKILSTKHPSVQLNSGALPKDTDKLSPDGFEAPHELTEMYKQHDMDKPMLFLMELTFLSAADVAGYHSLFEANLDMAEETGVASFFDNPDDGISGEDYYSHNAVLIPLTDGARDNLCVESRVDTHSEKHGRVIWMSIEDEKLIMVAPSLSAFLNRCAEDLEAGIYMSDEDGLHIDHSYEVSTVEYCINRWNKENK